MVAQHGTVDQGRRLSSVEIACIADLKCSAGEGLFWDEATQSLYFVDGPAGKLYGHAHADGRLSTWSLPEPLASAALDRRGRAVVAMGGGVCRYDLGTGAIDAVVKPPADRAPRFMQGSVDRQGRLWLGAAGPAREAMLRLDGPRGLVRALEGLRAPDGLAFSPNGRILYVADSHPDARAIWAYDYDQADGVPSRKRLFFDAAAIPGRPAGATVDANGCYWLAACGGWQLVRLSPAGRIDRVIDVPVEKPSRPAFGGPKLDVLYFTSAAANLARAAAQHHAGGLFAIKGVGHTGVGQPRFAG